MATQKTITVAGITYDSKSDAIRALLANGMKKSEVAKVTESHYSFVVTIENKMLMDASPAGQQKAKERADKKVAKETALKSTKAEKKVSSQSLNTVVVGVEQKQPKWTDDVDDELTEEDILMKEILNNEIPEDVQEQMRADGLIE